MKNSLQAIGLSLILWLGLNVGLMNAAILNNSEIGSDSILNNNEIVDQVLNEFNEQTISSIDEAESGSSAITSESDHIMNDGSFATLEQPEDGNVALDYEAISNQTAFVNITEPTPTSTVSLPTTNKISEFSDNTSVAENDSFLPEHGTFAMLLVGLGLLGLTARRRKDVI